METLNKDVIGIIVGYLDHESTSSLFKTYKLRNMTRHAINVLQCALEKLNKQNKSVKIRLLELNKELDALDDLRVDLGLQY